MGEVIPIVEEAIKTGARAVGIKEGVINKESAAKAREARLLIIIDKSMFKKHVYLTPKAGKQGGGTEIT